MPNWDRSRRRRRRRRPHEVAPDERRQFTPYTPFRSRFRQHFISIRRDEWAAAATGPARVRNDVETKSDASAARGPSFETCAANHDVDAVLAHIAPYAVPNSSIARLDR